MRARAHRRRSRPCAARADRRQVRVETKTARYTHAHAARTIHAARRLARRRRRYPGGVVPVLCIARAGRFERIEYDVLLVVSLDRLLPALRAAATAQPR